MKPQPTHTPTYSLTTVNVQGQDQEAFEVYADETKCQTVGFVFDERFTGFVKAVNAHKALLKACQEAYDLLASKESLSAEAVEVWGHLEQAIAKAEGK